MDLCLYKKNHGNTFVGINNNRCFRFSIICFKRFKIKYKCVLFKVLTVSHDRIFALNKVSKNK